MSESTVKFCECDPPRTFNIRAQGLDPITAMFYDHGDGKGSLILECYGEAWSYYWGAMGERSIFEFIAKTTPGYLITKLCRGDEYEVDMDEIQKVFVERDMRLIVEDAHQLAEVDEELSEIYGEDWVFHLPRRPTREAVYLEKIIDALQHVCKEIIKP